MAKLSSKGTLIKLSIASVFTTIAQLESITPPAGESLSQETPTLDQAGSGVPTDLTGYSNGGELSFSGYLDPALAGHKAVLALITTPAKSNWKVVYPDATEWPCTCSGVKVGASAAVGEMLKMDVTAKLDGLVTYPA